MTIEVQNPPEEELSQAEQVIQDAGVSDDLEARLGELAEQGRFGVEAGLSEKNEPTALGVSNEETSEQEVKLVNVTTRKETEHTREEVHRERDVIAKDREWGEADYSDRKKDYMISSYREAVRSARQSAQEMFRLNPERYENMSVKEFLELKQDYDSDIEVEGFYAFQQQNAEEAKAMLAELDVDSVTNAWDLTEKMNEAMRRLLSTTVEVRNAMYFSARRAEDSESQVRLRYNATLFAKAISGAVYGHFMKEGSKEFESIETETSSHATEYGSEDPPPYGSKESILVSATMGQLDATNGGRGIRNPYNSYATEYIYQFPDISPKEAYKQFTVMITELADETIPGLTDKATPQVISKWGSENKPDEEQ